MDHFKGSAKIAMAMLLAASGTAALADPAYQACIDRVSDNAGYSDCGSAYLKRADAALNLAWKRTFALASGQTRSDLLKEQRAWIAFKDASCAFYANGDSGREGQVLSFPACRGAVINQRTAALQSIGRDLAPR